MRLPETEVFQLLTEQFDVIEARWDANPFDEALAYALTIKEFMRDRQIQDVDEGIRQFVSFKQEQIARLSQLGFGTAQATFSLPPRLATQAA